MGEIMDKKGLKFPTYESFKIWFDEKTKNYRFKTGKQPGSFHEDFANGKAPLGFLKEWARQNYCFIQLTNANWIWILINYQDLWKREPDLYDAVASKIGSELSSPVPGGHGRCFVTYARYFGLTDEELFTAKPILEMEARINSSLVFRSQSPAQTAVRMMMEGFVGYAMKTRAEILREKYHLPDEALEFFDMHVQADMEEHGPEGEEFLEKLYQLGMVKQEDYEGMRMQVELSLSGSQPGHQGFSWQNVLYEQFCQENCARANT